VSDFDPFARKMRDAGLPGVAIRSFQHYFGQLVAGSQGLIPDADLAPIPELPALAELEDSRAAGERALAHTAVVKLNGGLGTSMGMTRAKSLLPIKEGLSFLDVIVRQVLWIRERTRCPVPLVLMDSFRTREDSLALLAHYPTLATSLAPDFLQHKVPRIRKGDLSPVAWPEQPEHEWCPPGHGDLYIALLTSGMLDALLGAGIRRVFVSNADNLGAVLDLGILGWFAESGAPFAMEVKERTLSDRKGGHLARLADGRLVLRETAQCPPEERESFEDVMRWPYFNTNNLWIDLRALKEALDEHQGVLPLPLICNEKPVDPKHPASPRVYQLETAMGAAISVFPGARAIRVGSERFAPVKTTADLLRVRSDAYVLTPDERVVAAPGADPAHLTIDLDPTFYRTVPQLEERFPAGPPSLVACRSLQVRGNVCFGAGVVCRGGVRLEGPLEIADGSVLEG